jgi:hypothetical protein
MSGKRLSIKQQAEIAEFWSTRMHLLHEAPFNGLAQTKTFGVVQAPSKLDSGTIL